jgi:hypothetical protein
VASDAAPPARPEAGLADMREWLDLFDDFTTEPIELIDAGDQQLVIYLITIDQPSCSTR